MIDFFKCQSVDVIVVVGIRPIVFKDLSAKWIYFTRNNICPSHPFSGQLKPAYSAKQTYNLHVSSLLYIGCYVDYTFLYVQTLVNTQDFLFYCLI